MRKKFKKLTVLSLLIVVVIAGLVGAGINKKAEAITINGDYIPDTYQWHKDTSKNQCNLGDGVHAYTTASWITERNDPGGPSNINITQGVDNIDLQYNLVGYNCASNTSNGTAANSVINSKALKRIQANVAVNTTATYGNPSGPVAGTTFTLDWEANSYSPGPPNERWYVKRSPATDATPVAGIFNLSGLGSLPPGNHSIRVTVQTRWAALFNANTYKCAGNEPEPGGRTTSSLSGPNCNTVPVTATINVTVSAPGSYTVQGLRTFGPGSGTPFPNGVGTTTLSGVSPTNDNDFRFTGVTGSKTISSSASISHGGKTYNYAGYTRCTNSTGCHTNNRNLDTTAPLPGLSSGFYDIYFHYAEEGTTGGGGPGGGPGSIRVDRVEVGTGALTPSGSGTVTLTGTGGGTDSINPKTWSNLPIGPRILSASQNFVAGPTTYTRAGYRDCGFSPCTNNSPDSTTSAKQVSVETGQTRYVRVYYSLSTAGGCPSLPNPHVQVFLPDQSPNNNGPPPSATTAPNNTYTQYERRNQTEVTSTNDISNSLGVDYNKTVPVPLISESYQQATISYQNFIEQCPYDRNQASVSYNSYYRQRNWRSASSPSYYTCSPGHSLSGSTCTYSYTVWHWHANDGSLCGFNTNGTARSCWHAHSATGTYSATAWYNYSINTAWGDRTRTNTVNAVIMEPCYDRLFDAEPSISGTPALNDDRESPTTSTMGGASIKVDFSVPHPEKGDTLMRFRSRVNNFNYRVGYSINGGAYTYENRTVNIAADDTNKQASKTQNVPGGSVTVSVSPPGPLATLNLRVGDRVCWQIITGPPTTGSMRLNGAIVSGGGTNSAQACTLTVVNWPYFKVFGNDVVAGGCGIGSNNINSFNRGSNAGSSVQHAAFALGAIGGGGLNRGFVTASLKPGAAPAPTPPHGFAFSNTSTPPGNYTSSDGLTCAPDFFGAAPADTTDILPPQIPGQLTTPNGDPKKIEFYRVTGGANLSPTAIPGCGGTNVPNGVRKVFYIEGTLTINGNLTSCTTWNSREEVPFVMFVAQNIRISGNVSRLDGIFVAQNSGAGTLNTCSNNNFNDCSAELVVNGSLIADIIELQRTRGSLRDARNHEGRSDVAVTNCSHGTSSANGTPGGQTCAAEIISFSPELFLSLSQVVAPEKSFKLDSFISLPPNL